MCYKGLQHGSTPVALVRKTSQANVNATATYNHRVAQAHIAFGTFWLASSIVFWKEPGALCAYAFHHESCSHIILVPLLSAYLLFTERKRIFSAVRQSTAAGIGVILAGATLYWMADRSAFSWRGNESLVAATVAIVLIWVGGFVCSYGLVTARAAFPLLFMLLMTPLPDSVLAWMIHSLQQRSTEVTYLLFRLLDVPVLRQGFVLSLPSVSIEVATECSGIRSSIALFIMCLLAAHFYLRTPWKIRVFVLLFFSAHRDQERNPNCHLDLAQHLCRSELSAWKFAS